MCGTKMLVVPPTLASFRGPEDTPAIVTPPRAAEDWKLVQTDEAGRFACPNPECDFAAPYDSALARQSDEPT